MAEIWEFWLPFSIALAGFLILIYDHIKDDRQLTKKVKEFYEAIENLIILYYSELILEKRREVSNEDDRIEKLKNERVKIRIKHSYYQEFIKYHAENLFKYLGIIYSGDNKNKIINKNTNYVLRTGGQLRFKDLEGEPRNIKEVNVIPDLLDITPEQIEKIDYFLASLRQYWKDNHYKWLFRPKIEKK